MKQRYFLSVSLCLLTFIFGQHSFGQNTLGVLTNIDSLTQDGYNLHYPHNQPHVYLLDNCGRIVHKWEDTPNKRPGNTAILKENGDLVRASMDVSVAGDPIWAGGGGEFVEILDWAGNVLWSFELEDSVYRLHHDMALMPNGNILMTVWDRRSGAEAIAAGRDTSRMPDGEVWGERIIEVQPLGTNSYNIVWEWNLWDHLVQDYDNTKANYGVVASNPRLIDLNFGDEHKDWIHMNSIDYNPDLDQILMSCPTFNEIWVIDHSTTTALAAGHTGGLSGRGGDIIWRWGNPMAYDRGDSTDTQLGYQHDAHWIDFDLSPGSDPDYGKIMVFNNRYAADHSAVFILQPQFDTYYWEYLLTGNTYAPASPDWIYTRANPTDLNSRILSGAQRLPNGNTLILSGHPGYSFEVTPAGQIVWEFINPLVQGVAQTNGDTIVYTSNLQFRFNRYPADFAAFTGQTLTPMGYLTPNADTTLCPTVTIGINDPLPANPLIAYPNPAQDRLLLSWGGNELAAVQIYDLAGALKWTGTLGQTTESIAVADWAQGLYFIRVNGQNGGKIAIQR